MRLGEAFGGGCRGEGVVGRLGSGRRSTGKNPGVEGACRVGAEAGLEER